MIAIAIARCQATFSHAARYFLSRENDLMRIAVAACAISFVLSYDAYAAFTDFSDYTQVATFAVGESFESNGVHFQAVDFRPVSNPVRVYGALLPSSGVAFLLPPNVQEISLRYVDGAAIAIAINGVEPTYPGQGGIPFHAGFSFLDGSSLGGVDVGTVLTTNTRTYEIGTLTLRGPINSLVIAGLELSLDDILIRVPEPSVGALLSIASLAVVVARHRRTIHNRD